MDNLWILKQDLRFNARICMQKGVQPYVPNLHNEDGYTLGSWARTQRITKDTMKNEFRKRLNDIGFNWDEKSAQWEFGFKKLIRFWEREGNCLVMSGHLEGEFKLFNWVGYQRKAKHKLNKEQITRLENIGFVWNAHLAAWEYGFSKLCKFRRREGHCRVPNNHKEDQVNLYLWVRSQRRFETSLAESKREKLNEIDFIWDPLSDDWEKGFQKLVNFKKKEGHCSVPTLYSEGGYKLGEWVQYQRRRRLKLDKQRLQRLDELNFVWDALVNQWQLSLHHLRQFINKNGHAQVPRGYLTDCGFKLGARVAQFRNKKKSLPEGKIVQLDELGFIWGTTKTTSASKND
jgi:hypothetical protein